MDLLGDSMLCAGIPNSGTNACNVSPPSSPALGPWLLHLSTEPHLPPLSRIFAPDLGAEHSLITPRPTLDPAFLAFSILFSAQVSSGSPVGAGMALRMRQKDEWEGLGMGNVRPGLGEGE